MTITAAPLTWPSDWKKTPSHQRSKGKFGRSGKTLSVADGVARVREELRKMGLRNHDIIVSTNLKLRLDGLPRSDQPEPSDSGVAVYWETKKGNRVIAIDQYFRVADNLAAIAATLDAMRAIERHGGAEILNRVFTGFTALPAPVASRSWREVLFHGDAPPTEESITRAWRIASSRAHPDKPGGSHSAMQAVNAARDQAMKEVA